MLPAARRGTGATFLALATVVLACFVAAPAGAKTKRYTLGDFQYAKATSTIPFAGPTETTTARVSPGCDKGWSLSGGGGLPTGLPGHTLLESTGIAGSKRWFVDAGHLDSDKTKLIGYSICVHDRIVDSAVHAQSIGAGPTTGSSNVSCPSGLSATGGGVETIGDPLNWALNSTLPGDDGSDADAFPDDQWRGYVLYGGATPSDFLIEIICTEDLPSYERKDTPLPTGSNAKATAKCPAGQHITGGGIVISGSVSEGFVVSSYPIDGKDKGKAPDDGWRVSGFNNNGAPPKTLTAWAICLPQPA